MIAIKALDTVMKYNKCQVCSENPENELFSLTSVSLMMMNVGTSLLN